MVMKMLTSAIILVATFTVSEFSRIRLNKVEGRKHFETQAQIASQNDEEDTKKTGLEDKTVKAFEDGATSAADGTEANSPGAPVTALESPAALVQEVSRPTHILAQEAGAAPQRVVEAGRARLGSPPDKFRKQLGLVPNENPSSFSKTLNDIWGASDYYSRFTILKVACDSRAFSCEEIIQIAKHCWRAEGIWAWQELFMVFAKGRNKTGCISDPANATRIIDYHESKWPEPYPRMFLNELETTLINNDNLKPAKGVGPPPRRLQTGVRTDEDMDKLLKKMAKLQLIKAYGPQGRGGKYMPPSPSVKEFESWLKQIRAQGEQFSGPQLVSIVKAIPKRIGSAQVVAALLQYFAQYVTGVTCEEVKQIISQTDLARGGKFWLASLHALKSNIIDGQNKVDIVTFTDKTFPGKVIIGRTGQVLKNVGVGDPPMNNPIFGLVKGNPVILVVDESTSMDTNFTLGNDTFTRRKFCHSQLETVLEALPNGTYFNVIQYSSSAVKVFEKAVLISKTRIDAALEAMGSTWRRDYTLEQDPAEMVVNIKVFALNFKHLKRSTARNSMEALQLAYATADLPSQHTDNPRRALRDLEALLLAYATADLPSQHTDNPRRALRDHGAFVASKVLPQIYFLTSGPPDGGAHQILDNIDEFDNDRNIPVNSIAFITPADPVAKQFGKDLANKTGGFFRSIEQASR